MNYKHLDGLSVPNLKISYWWYDSTINKRCKPFCKNIFK